MMQKLIMTAGVIFIFQGTMIQVAAAFVITFGDRVNMLALYIRARVSEV